LSLVVEDAMIVATALSIVGLGFVCWLIFTLAIYALPFFAGLSAGLFAYGHGAGLIGAIVVGLTAGALTLVVGQLAFASIRSPWMRTLIAAVYAAPAGVAGYHVVHNLSAIGGTSEPWRVAFSAVGAVVVAGFAWARISDPDASGPGRGTSAPSYPGSAMGAAGDR
jgi:hypothetical protein